MRAHTFDVLICSNIFLICSICMSLVGHRTNRIPHWITSACIFICVRKQIKFILTGTCDSCLFAPVPRELDSCSNHRKGRLADSTCGKYRWFSRYVIAAMLVDKNKRFFISSFCSCTSNCTLEHCCLCPLRVIRWIDLTGSFKQREYLLAFLSRRQVSTVFHECECISPIIQWTLKIDFP